MCSILRFLTCIQELDEELAFLMKPGRQDAYTEEDTSDLFRARSRAEGALASYLNYVWAREHPSEHDHHVCTCTCKCSPQMHVQVHTPIRTFEPTEITRFPPTLSKKLAVLKGNTVSKTHQHRREAAMEETHWFWLEIKQVAELHGRRICDLESRFDLKSN